jgi:SAM-dependent methyltransferase
VAWEKIARWLLCPSCEASFAIKDGVLCCARGHTFDIARAGYVNLLAVRGRRQAGGDTAEMVAARSRFLDRGLYRQLADTIAACALQCLSERGQQSLSTLVPFVVDAGCGEGYYLAHLRQLVGMHPDLAHVVCSGFDFSSDAIGQAARREPSCVWLIADARDAWPYRDGAVSLLLNIFAPRNPQQLARVIASDGHLIVVIPTAQHLRELRAQVPLLGMQAGKRDHVLHQLSPAFVLRKSVVIEYTIALDSPGLVDLIRMTPSNRHLTAQDWRLIERIAGIQTQVSCEVLVLQRGGRDSADPIAVVSRAAPRARRPPRARRRRASSGSS